MSTLLKKLNHKNQEEMLILNAPPEFEPFLKEFKLTLEVSTELKAKKEFPFMIAFVQTQKEVDTLVPKMAKVITEDGLFWMAYPKGTSKKYKSAINRDHGWAILGELGFEGVRLIAIDDDWSCMRFRKAENIKTMNRSPKMTLSKVGKEKIKKKK
jgi:hypothetical protein